uniref:Tail assembly chaperone protein n=1 Tax=Siphoviridae sp. ctRiO19 TaxID=2826337 RepID=A0A8S5LX34_9CAUD|nr:MAG TPA: tail assembly chaperone protein [Siphoviridae sp. ctRiO19]
MRLETKNKSVNLVLRTKKIITLKNLLKEKSFEIGFTKGYTENDPEVLSKIIFVLSEDDEGQKVFNSSEDVLDFLDDLRIENKESFQDIYGKIAEALNDEGFFIE